MKHIALVLALTLLGTHAHAKRKPITIQVVGTTTAKIMVNGKEMVPGQELPANAKIEVSGPATLLIGGATVKMDGNTTLQLSGKTLSVATGSAEVTTGSGKTTKVAAGESINTAGPPDAVPTGAVAPLPASPNPAQNKATVSPSAP